MSLRTPIVRLSSFSSLSGRIIKSKPKERDVFAFLGVPYAEQPARFEYPSKLKLWTGCRDATKFGPISPQDLNHFKRLPVPMKIPDTVSEGCLYLNVWTPTLDPHSKLPVMVWIHGGGFTNGWSNLYQGVTLASECDVVFVSINYRLGAFGFLASEDGALPGNYGFMDQVEALRWVREYIGNFGGDADNVTVFGESAGAMSVALHVMSGESRGLFRRAIAQSGTGFSNAFVTSRKKAENELQRALRKLGFQGGPRDRVEFLRSKSVTEIVDKTSPIPFRPVIDGRLISNSAEAVYKSQLQSKVDFMLGCNSHEGALFTIGPLRVRKFRNLEEAKAVVKRLVQESFWDVVEDKERLAAEVTQEYLLSRKQNDLENDLDLEEIQKGMVALVGDIWFCIPTVSAADCHSETASTYVYEFAHAPSASLYPGWVRADHSGEIPFVLGDVLADRLPFMSRDERQLSRDMMQLWANFARTGNPSPELDGIQWPKYDQTNKSYLEIKGPDQFSSCRNFLSKRQDFWSRMLEKYARKNFNSGTKSKY